MTARHLLTVWNPLYTSDVDQHFALLLDWAHRADEKKAKPEDIYVWWGKVKSPNRQQPLEHRDDILAFAKTLDPQDRAEANLYVTDYRSLYVAELLDIEEGTLPPDEQAHVPAYYGAKELKCDFWFMVGDFRRLVIDDLPLVAAELQRLHNVHYHDKPVSIYGGIRELPLLVTRPDGTEFFRADEREAVTGGKLWLEWEQEHGAGLSAVQADLRDNVLGENVWNALEWTARTSLAQGERLYRDHRNEPGYDFSDVILSFAKALEVQVSRVLRDGASKLAPAVRTVSLNDRQVDLVGARGLTLGQMARAIGGERELAAGLTKALENGAWFTGQLPAILDDLTEVRNAAAHSDGQVGRDVATRWRNRLLGVGSHGDIAQLAAVRLKRGAGR